MGKSFFGRHGDRHDPVPTGVEETRPSGYTPLQRLYLERLTRLVQKLQLHGRYLATTDRRMQLLNRAALATFRSCRDLELETEARAILTGLRRDLCLPPPRGSAAPPVARSPAERAASGQQLG